MMSLASCGAVSCVVDPSARDDVAAVLFFHTFRNVGATTRRRAVRRQEAVSIRYPHPWHATDTAQPVGAAQQVASALVFMVEIKGRPSHNGRPPEPPRPRPAHSIWRGAPVEVPDWSEEWWCACFDRRRYAAVLLSKSSYFWRHRAGHAGPLDGRRRLI